MKNCQGLTDNAQPEAKTESHITPYCTEHLGRPKGLKPLNLDELLGIEPKKKQKERNVSSPTDTPHRTECVGKPKGLQPVNLDELLKNKPKNSESDEIDTGPPVGNEIW